MTTLARVTRVLLVLWAVSFLTFMLSQLTPGDPARTVLGNEASDAEIARVHEQLGLDKPVLLRYFIWLGGVLRLDFGETLKPPVRDVGMLYLNAAPATLQIVLTATIIAIVVGVLLGAVSAANEGGWFDRLAGVTSYSLIAIPPFIMGLLLIMLFVFRTKSTGIVIGLVVLAAAVWLVLRKCTVRPVVFRSPGWQSYALAVVAVAFAALCFTMQTFPRYGWVPASENFKENLQFVVLPALTLALGAIPLYTQMLRTDMVRTLQENFVTVAWAKGMPHSRIIMSEALRPSLFSVVTVIGLSLGNMIGGTVIVETIFGIPGIGRVLVDAIIVKDFPVIQAGVLIVAVCFVIINIVVDASYALIDPRVRK